MMIPLLTELRAIGECNGVSLESLYSYVGISRQGYFQGYERLKSEAAMMTTIALQVHKYRSKKDFRAGSRSLYHNLGIKGQFGIGVTKFERLMSKYELTLLALRIKVVTTKSCYRSWSYSDLRAGLKVNNINQLVVGDLTYINIDRHRYYLFTLIDVYSARIVGYSLGKRMRAIDAKQAFDGWLKLRGKERVKGCIHHTDGGSQYFSRLYLSAMKERGLCISVAKNCLDNGFAEQRNGLLKHHLFPTIRMSKEGTLRKELRRIMDYYNEERKQAKLGWLSPIEFEVKYSARSDRPLMNIYDRAKGEKTERHGF